MFSYRGFLSLAVLAATVGGSALAAQAAAFTAGNIAVYRVGDGSSALASTGNPVFVDEYTPAGTLVQSVNAGIVASGTATSEGLMTLSADGNYLVMGGYTSTGASSIANSTSIANPRVVSRIDGAGTVDTSTALTDWASGNNPRGVASSNGTDIWVTGAAGGVRYTTLGSTTSTQLSTTVTNIRSGEIAGGQLYISTSSGSTIRLGAVGSGEPTTTGQTIVNLTGLPANTGSPYAFFFADLSSTEPGLDTLYVADDAAGIIKYTDTTGTWTAVGTIGAAANSFRGLTGVVSGSNITLFATTGASAATGGGTLSSIVDTGGFGAPSAVITPIATLTNTSNEAFRGVALVPTAVPEPASLALLGLGALALVRRRK